MPNVAEAYFNVAVILIAITSVMVFHWLVYKQDRHLAVKLTAALIGIIFSLILFETAIRLLPSSITSNNPWFKWYDTAQNTANDQLPYERKKGLAWKGIVHGDLALLNNDLDPYHSNISFETDDDGFRNPSSTNEVDILFLGDSYTEGASVNQADCFVQLVSDNTGLKAKNLAVSGYSTPEEVITFSKYGLQTKAQIAVLQVSESNDIQECHRYYNWLRSGSPQETIKPSMLPSIPLWKRYSLLHRLYELIFGPVLNDYLLEGEFISSNETKYIVRFLQVPHQGMGISDSIGWDVMKNSVDTFLKESQANGIQPIVLLIPDKIKVMGPYTQLPTEVGYKIYESTILYEPYSLSENLKNFCRNRKVSFIDATEKLEAAAQKGVLVYKPMDTHLSEAGHILLADTLSKFILTHGKHRLQQEP